MPLFQSSVLSKHLKLQDKIAVARAYKKYKTYFHNISIQQNIKESKEEQFQEGFLRELFVNIFDYTLNPLPNFNLTTELKNEKDAKKADGAVLKNGQAVAVIELKSSKTKDLERIRQQAFDYKANQTGCIYVITSNFEKIRFYIENAVEFEEFHLFSLNEEQFSLLYLCLQKDNIFNNVPLKIKNDSIAEEENITKSFYSDYSIFKRELYRDLVKNNLNNKVFRSELQKEDSDRANKNIKLSLFEKSQKLIDRFLFIFFAEDRGLLPPNSTLAILNNWKKLADLDAAVPLFDRFKLFFTYLDEGRKGTDKQAEIFAYNGGLFKPNTVLDSLVIDDGLLLKHTKKLSNYNFESQVDVNILGHIFENSLNDIENINAEIEETKFDKQKAKRKKDGIFYTPKYITKSIVDSTVGRLCSDKKDALGVKDDEYRKSKKGRKKTTLIKLKKNLDDYRDWLLSITICDPACGSGAFLNQALDFLIKEHQYIDELEASLFGGGLVFRNIENTILENNIYGVDLNEESVEIAKLSLWLRTAQPRRKLNNLNQNIKCGNSLIDSKTLAGDKSFNWKDEFPDIFENGGFDVVLGNPPYGAELTKNEVKYIEKNYKSFEYQVNSYVVFYEKGLDITKENGILGFITPATFTYQHYFKKIRDIFNNLTILCISKYFYEVFDDADIGDSVTWIVKKSISKKDKIEIANNMNKQEAINFTTSICNYNAIVNSDGTYNLNGASLDFQSLLKKGEVLVNLCQIIVGIKPYQTNKGKPKQTKEIVKTKIFTSTFKKDSSYINCIIGKDFHRYRFIQEPKMFLSYGEWLAEPRNSAPFFDDEKIILRQTSDSLIGTIDSNKRINLNNVYNVGKPNESISLKYLLGLLNSKLLNVIYQHIAQEKGRVFAEVKKVNLAKLPIVVSDESKSLVEGKVDCILIENINLAKIINNYLKYMQSQYQLETLSSKLNNWSELDFNGFIVELNKVIKKSDGKKLSKTEEIEWMEAFETHKTKAENIKDKINKINMEIDSVVYDLYGLTEDEIKAIEQA